ncbi:spore coat protein U domain-containing protein [Cedecea davisae]|uniref:spore coat protein U domain-containing protein n=1 Tax=Cedecea davisae TaxID=158484 RepID=UPI00243204A4|nr:spore coat protein U domain-containing protein [Cedecea davisae]
MLLRRLTTIVLLLTGIFSYQATAAALPSLIAGSITVSANIAGSCEVTTTGSETPLSGHFGTISFDTSDWMSHKSINAEDLALTVTCTSGNVPVIKLNQGKSYDPKLKLWQMVNKTAENAKLAYQLYSDSTHSTVIEPEKDINTKKENPFKMIIAGQIPGIPDVTSVAAGDYQDTIQMTVDWSGS